MYNYLTEKCIRKLEDEIEYRKVIVRKQINEDLKEARAHGDLSENFEYKAAKRERARNESRISIESPLGKAIFKHKVGDILLVNSLEEKYSVKILSIIKYK